ncbi:MAG TPA: response regulator [Stellaceae bacterium]|nr:response regulator [Stellaceae bacterium]HEV2551896.1 response regulator [Stellaceae bacterium]
MPLSEPREPGDETRPGKKILVVEDNELNRKLLTDLLSFQGHEILETAEGLEAIRIAHDAHPDLILLDIQLPDVSGFDVARRLKADDATRSIPIIAVTAFAMRNDEQRALQSGCDTYVSKPINVANFLARIEKWLGLSS